MSGDKSVVLRDRDGNAHHVDNLTILIEQGYFRLMVPEFKVAYRFSRVHATNWRVINLFDGTELRIHEDNISRMVNEWVF